MITQLDVVKNFTYKNGHLYWKKPRSGIQVKDQAGSIDSKGYIRIRFNGKKYLNHRLIFLMHYGYLPKMLDHIDNNRLNNCIENLRPATREENGYNKPLQKNNKSGAKNVHWHTQAKRWVVSIGFNKTFKYVGMFKDLELADLVAQEARDKYHKEFACHY
jgi:hypothetical protein